MNEQTPALDPERIAALVERAEAGDGEARDVLFASLYGELHRLAEHHLRKSSSQITMGTTTLLHEAYLSLNSRSNVAFPAHVTIDNLTNATAIGAYAAVS